MFYVLNECNIREKLQYAIKVESRKYVSKQVNCYNFATNSNNFFKFIFMIFYAVMKHFDCVDK